jgi:hypothetical protein
LDLYFFFGVTFSTLNKEHGWINRQYPNQRKQTNLGEKNPILRIVNGRLAYAAKPQGQPSGYQNNVSNNIDRIDTLEAI